LLQLRNRIVMTLMTHAHTFSPQGNDVATYYRSRTKGQVGLILTEGTVMECLDSFNGPNIPHFCDE